MASQPQIPIPPLASVSTFKAGNIFIPALISDAADRAQLVQYARNTGVYVDHWTAVTIADIPEEVDYSRFTAEPVKDVKQVDVAALKAKSTVAHFSQSSSSKDPKADVTPSAEVLKKWKDDSKVKIDPAYLSYLRTSARQFDRVELYDVVYEATKSQSLTHRKMLTHLITKYGLEAAIRMVEEKAWVRDPVDTAAITGVPKGRIELLLCEYAMAHSEGVYHRLLWALYNNKCSYDPGLLEFVPEFIGAGSRAELDSGKTITPEETRRRRENYLRNVTTYMRSLFLSDSFRAILASMT